MDSVRPHAHVLPGELRAVIRAIDDDSRIRIVITLLEKRDLSIRELVEQTRLKRAKLWIGLRVLINAGLVESHQWHKRMDTRLYRVTSFGEGIIENLFSSMIPSSIRRRVMSATVEPAEKDKIKVVRAFMSASFDESAEKVVGWFREMAHGIGIDTVWLKEEHEARPTQEKIIRHIKNSNAFVQVITADVKRLSKEAGWLGNEIAWAYDSTPGNCIAVFVEEGIKASGLAREVADNLSFHRQHLDIVAPKVTKYLLNLKSRVLEARE
jgi:DNA-binding transcriptional regulator GbsR (MarR family)